MTSVRDHEQRPAVTKSGDGRAPSGTGGIGGKPALVVTRSVPPLREQVIEQLRQAIIEMRLPPGTRLVERELIASSGVSRTTIREALRELAAAGLVVPVGKKGVEVASISLARAIELYEIRGVLEAMAARRCAERATDQQLRELDRALTAYEGAARAGRPTALLRTGKRFYDALFDGADNVVIRGVLEGLQARVAALRALSLTQPGRAEESAAELRTIVRAIEARNGERAAAEMSDHVDRATATIRRALESAESQEQRES